MISVYQYFYQSERTLERLLLPHTASTCPFFVSFFSDGAMASKLERNCLTFACKQLTPEAKKMFPLVFQVISSHVSNPTFCSFFKHLLLYHTALLRHQPLPLPYKSNGLMLAMLLIQNKPDGEGQ